MKYTAKAFEFCSNRLLCIAGLMFWRISQIIFALHSLRKYDTHSNLTCEFIWHNKTGFVYFLQIFLTLSFVALAFVSLFLSYTHMFLSLSVKHPFIYSLRKFKTAYSLWIMNSKTYKFIYLVIFCFFKAARNVQLLHLFHCINM